MLYITRNKYAILLNILCFVITSSIYSPIYSVNTLTIVTGNQGKLREFKAALQPDGFNIGQIDVDLTEIQETDPIEVIKHKAQEAIKLGHKNFIIEDTSLYIDGMHNLPGPLIRWFVQEIGPEGIYKLAQTFGNSSAKAEAIIAYVDNKGDIRYFTGTTNGTIVSPLGSGGFAWDSIFVPNGADKTFAQMTVEEKSAISHRAKAIEKLREYLNGQKEEL